MAKRFRQEFKQQTIEYALSNSHESLALIAQRLGVGYSTLDKSARAANSTHSSKRALSPELRRILDLEKKVKQLKEVNDILKKRMCTFSANTAGKVHGNSGYCYKRY